MNTRTPQAFITMTISNKESKVPVLEITEIVQTATGVTMAVVRTHNRTTVRSLSNIMIER